MPGKDAIPSVCLAWLLAGLKCDIQLLILTMFLLRQDKTSKDYRPGFDRCVESVSKEFA